MKLFTKILIVSSFSIAMIGCGGGGTTTTGGGISYLQVANSSDSDSNICNVYSNPNSSTTWGDDRLSGTISPGTYRQFSTTNCDINYDLKVVFCDGYTDEIINYSRPCGTTTTKVFRNW